ncbi:AMP-binding protein [Streptomyces sp. NPDC048527]|uniref:AMP-binding protein n=1 Tax=Streptomyces sp. NPDC048527 TaxID=3365568 RepID=UPI00371BAE03
MRVMELNLWRIFQRVSEALPERSAVIQGEHVFTYGRLADQSARLAHVLGAHGLGCRAERDALQPWEIGQDRIGLLMHNCPEYLVGMFGAFAARAAPFNINYSYVADELEYVLNDAEAAAVVYQARFAPKIAEVLPRLKRQPLLIQIADASGTPLLPGALDYSAALEDADPAAIPADQQPDDINLLYTGGTTGMPKGVLWRQSDLFLSALARGSHRTGTAGAEEVAAYAAQRRGSRILVCAPMMHGAASLNSFSALLYADTVVFSRVDGQFDAADVCRTIERERINSMMIVGEAFARPLLRELAAHDYDTSSLRILMSGGAPMTQRSKDGVAERLPRVVLHELLGASETGGALQRADESDRDRLDAGVFARRPGANVEVLDEARTRIERPGHTEPGWFAVAGSIPLGYLGDEEKTRATFASVAGVRWSVPGDRARLRADGLIEVLGRDSTTINTGGEKVFAEEVEEALLTHPAVKDVAVAGRHSERWGQEVVALVSLVDGVQVADDELREAAARRIARYKLPKAVVRVDQVRRTPSGKIDRPWAGRAAADSVA